MTCLPFIPGMFRSSKIKSGVGASACGGCLRRKARQSWPSSARCRLTLSRAAAKASRIRSTSFSWSSTRSTSAALPASALVIVRSPRLRNGEEERAALTQRGFYPDPAPVPMHDASADGQPDAGSGKRLLGVEPAKDLEDLRLMRGIDSDPVVSDREHPLGVLPLGRDLDAQRGVGPVLDGVADQV